MSNIILRKFIHPLIIRIGKKIERRSFSKPPIFIVACPRSGTTMLLSILSSHPNIHAIKRQTYAFGKWKNENGTEIPQRIDRLYRELILHKIDNSSQRWLEKTPQHLENIARIMNYFPEAKIINMYRDGRDVVTSKHPEHQPGKYWVEPGRWVEYVKKSLNFSNSPNLLSIKYEELVKNYEEEINKVLEFLNEEYTAEMTEWYDNTAIKDSKHIEEGIQRLHTKSIGRWRKEEHRERVQQFMDNQEAVELMKKLNYINE